MRPRPPLISLLLPGLLALGLAVPASALATQASATTPARPPTQTVPSAATTEGPTTPPAGSTGSTGESGSGPASSGGPSVASAPRVQIQKAQRSTREGSGGSSSAGTKRNGAVTGPGQAEPTGGSSSSSSSSSSSTRTHAGARAPAPSTLTPTLPLALASPFSGVPGFFIESFRIPPFLLPVYQAAGTAYGIPWQVLAAINEVETDYGRDLSVSSAGAEGWMQFLPSSWAEYGVDANAGGFRDPYNPADAIFAAAAYLRAAGGNTNIRAAVYAYNHSQAYVASVMLRAQLLGGTPPELLGAISGLSAARFPVHAPSHFSDGFQSLPASGSRPPRTLVGTTIYSQVGAPVIAVQEGEIVQVGRSPSLGRYVSLRDASGDSYVYAELGSVARLYPVLRRVTITHHDHRGGGAAVGSAPSGPATAGTQPPSPGPAGAAVPGLALGATGLQPAPDSPSPAPSVSAASVSRPRPPATVRVFREGPNDVYLYPLHAGVRVLAGTVLGHVGAGASTPEAPGPSAVGTSGASAGGPLGGPHMLFQIRPPGLGAPLIDPKPILDGWVALENASVFRVHGKIRGLLSSREAAKRRARRVHPRYRPPSASRALTGSQSAARPFSSGLQPDQWIELIARLGEIPYPRVASGTSGAAIPDQPPLPSAGAHERRAGGNG